MDFNQLQQALAALQVDLSDAHAEYRAALYIDRLQDAHLLFTTTFQSQGQGSLGAAGAFAAAALNDPRLLKPLARILDLYVGGAVRRDWDVQPNPTPTYQAYFDTVILDPNDPVFRQNVQQFLNRYPILGTALTRVCTNFTTNVGLACTRAYNDRAALQTFFADLYQANFTIAGLSRIESSGSDFHKGGQQVLFLTFDASHVDAGNVQQVALKVVYKPGDIEADCLLVGEAAPVNAVTPNFMTASLFEIYNDRIAAMKQADANFTGQPLPTYRLLPRNYMSAQAQLTAQTLRNAYGYIQYLDQDLSGTSQEFLGFLPFATSDFIVFLSERATTDIIRDFHRQQGAIAAIASSFSLVDLHMENLRVIQRRPNPIDLEASLTEAVNAIGTTLLLANSGGFNGLKLETAQRWVLSRPPAQAVPLDYQLDRKLKYLSNRLWEATFGGGHRVVGLDLTEILRGFADGMAALRELVTQGVQNTPLVTWFNRLDNVLVRVLPIKTRTLQDIQTALYVNSYSDYPNTAQQALRDQLIKQALTVEYFTFTDLHDPGANPRFVVLAPGVSEADFDDLDIPSFYHRIGAASSGIVNSRAAAVPIPATVVVSLPNNLNQQEPVTANPPIFNRNTYFNGPPTATAVRAGQVTPLGANPAFGQRRTQIAQTIVTFFQTSPQGPGAIVPVKV